MRRLVSRDGRWSATVVAGVLVGAACLAAQATAPAAGSVGPRPNVGPADRPIVVPAAVDRGKRVWNAECITCHGAAARGSATAPSLIRSLLVLRDRQGSELGPFLKKGHPMQSGRPSASLTDAEIGDVMQFLRQRINDTLRGSPVFVPGNVLTGDAKAGAAYFAGDGGCVSCHSSTGDLAHVGSKYTDPVDLQQRMLFPVASRTVGRFGGAAAGPNRTAIAVTVTPAAGAALSGVLVEEDDFFVTFRDAGGAVHTARRAPGVKIQIADPLAAHHAWLDRVSDTNIHDLVAYLVTLK
jgi:cytochrome c oxidase cbb3-type subunit III